MTQRIIIQNDRGRLSHDEIMEMCYNIFQKHPLLDIIEYNESNRCVITTRNDFVNYKPKRLKTLTLKDMLIKFE